MFIGSRESRLLASRYVVLWSFWAITLIASLSQIAEERFDDADIEAVSLHAQQERLEIKMFVLGETVDRTLLL